MANAYRPEIDGLRAIAVVSVILYHGKVIPMPGGYAGVDVFFVISGYLIAGILLDELQAGTSSLWRFYERRVRRILPALVLVLLATAALIWAIAIPPMLSAFSESLGAVVGFASNLYFGANSGYFSPALEEAPLLHTWSLAVEEQFYLAFPPLLALIWRRWPAQVTQILAGGILLSLALAEWGWRVNADANFFFPLSRAWELLVGALAVHLARRLAPRPRPLLALAGLAMIALALAFQDDTTPTPTIFTSLPVIGAALVLVHARADQGIGRLLASPGFVGIGLISYSAYLWHQPLFAAARMLTIGAPSAGVMLALTGLTFVLAWGSWAFVEQPFRRAKGRWLPDRARLFQVGAAAMAVVAALAAAGIISHGNDRIWRDLHPDQAKTLDLILAASEGDGPPGDVGPCRFNLRRIGPDERARIHACAAQHGPAAVVLGDSHGIDLFNALATASPAPFLLGITDGGCRPADAGEKCAYDDLLALAHDQPSDIATVLFVQSGAYLLTGPDGRAGSRQIFRRAAATEAIPPLPPDEKAITKLASYLTDLGKLVPVTMLAPRIEPQVPPALVLQKGCQGAFALRPGQAEAFQHLDQRLTQTFAGSNVTYVPLALQTMDMRQDFMTCDRLFWSDGDHWSRAGEARFGPRLLPILPAAFR